MATGDSSLDAELGFHRTRATVWFIVMLVFLIFLILELLYRVHGLNTVAASTNTVQDFNERIDRVSDQLRQAQAAKEVFARLKAGENLPYQLTYSKAAGAQSQYDWSAGTRTCRENVVSEHRLGLSTDRIAELRDAFHQNRHPDQIADLLGCAGAIPDSLFELLQTDAMNGLGYVQITAEKCAEVTEEIRKYGSRHINVPATGRPTLCQMTLDGSIGNFLKVGDMQFVRDNLDRWQAKGKETESSLEKAIQDLRGQLAAINQDISNASDLSKNYASWPGILLQVLVTLACLVGVNAGYQNSRAHIAEMVAIYRAKRRIDMLILARQSGLTVSEDRIAEALRDLSSSAFSPKTSTRSLAPAGVDAILAILEAGSEVVVKKSRERVGEKG
jgi:hypothetical protein